ncbi:MAG: fasciclin domain-containing protein [Saprospiraceae bacterium]|nr:fasciclin domain-containing protein [Saprospiraceae bacterium]
MKKISLKSVLTLIIAIVAVNVFAQCSNDKNKTTVKASAVQPGGDIIDIAASNDSFSTLVAAVQAADLVDALKGDGPFTVFAPTNDAFDKLPDGTVATLLKPENKDQLAAVLTYHVVSGSLDSGAVVNAIKAGNGKANVTTLNGGTLTAMMQDGGVVLKDANGNISKVVTVDIKGTNGVIHVIDTVVLP